MTNGQSLFWTDPAGSRRNLRLLRALFWIATIVTGFLQAWSARFWLSPDATNYLDIASAYLRGDWKNAVNAYWSPLFSWLLAFALRLFHPSAYSESTLLHLLNFVALLVSLLSFEFFFRAFLRARKHWGWSGGESQELPELGWWALGYALFLSTSLFVLNAAISTPDVWVAALTYFVAGLILRICTNGGGWGLFAALGFALGFAYLAKSFYSPMGFVFLLTAWLAAGNLRKTMKYAALGLVAFLLVAGPWVTVLSRAKHRLTFGDVGKLAFAMFVDDLPQPYFWQGENGTGNPRHPVRLLLAKPRLFEFAAPIGGSYPPSFDPSYWMEGAEPHFRLRGQLRVLRQSFGTFFQFFVDQMEYGVAVLFLFFLALGAPDWAAAFRKQWFLWAPSLVACLMYAVVLVEGRYVAPFILLLWVAVFSCLFGSASQLSRRGAVALVFALLLITGLHVVKTAIPELFSTPHNIDFEVAKGLQGLGIQPGDKVAGLSRVAEAHWARLAGVKIVSEIPLGDEGIFWVAAPEEKRKVFDVFAATGAVVVVTKDPPHGAVKEGWTPLGNTAFYAYRLPAKPD
jgi:hypothetical protein